MSLLPTSPTPAPYTQPSVSNSARRDTISILADGRVQVLVDRLDANGNIIEVVTLTVPQAGGNVTDSQGRIYGAVSDGTFTTAGATMCTQVDSALASWATAGKFTR